MSSPTDAPVPEVDTSRPHPARMYDYFLGGKDHFAADRQAVDKVLAAFPSMRTAARENRAFLSRAVRYLAAEAGIQQFLDIGTGLPTASNVHEVAQSVAPSSRIVYVDNDPLVLAHARALLASGREGRTAYIHADLRDPQAILDHPVTRDVLDFTRPVALMLVAILHFIANDDKPEDIVATLLSGLPSGSYLVASHGSGEHDRAVGANAMRTHRESGIPFQLRDSDDFARLAFTGLELVPPGVVPVSEWRPDEDGLRPAPAEVGYYGGVGRKPLRVSRNAELAASAQGRRGCFPRPGGRRPDRSRARSRAGRCAGWWPPTPWPGRGRPRGRSRVRIAAAGPEPIDPGHALVTGWCMLAGPAGACWLDRLVHAGERRSPLTRTAAV